MLHSGAKYAKIYIMIWNMTEVIWGNSLWKDTLF